MAADTSPIVLLHGFTQTGACWEPVAAPLRDAAQVVHTPDLPGHGDATDVAVDLWGAAEHVAQHIIATSRGEPVPATLVGYSFGGRVALHLALARPDLVGRLVLVGATAGIADEEHRSERRTADDALAATIERDGVGPFLDRWLAQPLFASLAPSAQQRGERERNTAAGLAASLRLCGTGSQQPLWDRLGEITCPVLLVTGALDQKFTDISRAMVTCFTGPVSHVIVPRAGHSVAWEAPRAFLAAFDAWRRGSERDSATPAPSALRKSPS